MSTQETPSKGKSNKTVIKTEDRAESALLLAAGELTPGDVTEDGKLRYIGGTLFEEVR